MLTYCRLCPREQTSVKFKLIIKYFHWRKGIWKRRLWNVGHLASASIAPMDYRRPPDNLADSVKWGAVPIILTHWGQVTHICVSKLIIIGSDNGLSPGRRQAIIWTNAGILLIWPLRTNFSEILIAIETFSFKKMHLKISSTKWRPFCLGLNMLSDCGQVTPCGDIDLG